MKPDKFRTTVSKAVCCGYRKYYDRYWFSNGHFALKKSAAPDVWDAVDSCLQGVPTPVQVIIPKSAKKADYVPTSYIKSYSGQPIVHDGKTAFNARYYWLITKHLGLRIRASKRKKEICHVITDAKGKILGALMPIRFDGV